MIFKPHGYQRHATEHIIENDACGLLLEMGLGKTVSTLTAIDQLMYQDLSVNKVLVIAPKRVAEDTWLSEVNKWDHLRHLKLSIVLGTEKQRKEALATKADIYVINRENVAWLVSYLGGAWPFDMVVIDELSSFKNAKSKRFKALRAVRSRMNRVVGLTGTPAPNGLLDLWPQMYLLDQGQRLGKTLTGFRNEYFKQGKSNGHVVYNYDLKKETDNLLGADIYEKEILHKISDICISMKARDYLELPPRIDRIKSVKLSQQVMDQYFQFEKELILNLANEEEITAVNAAALTNKLLQFTNGAVYDAEKNYHEIHDEKLEALEEDIEAANGEPVLVFYQYQHDLARILKRFRALKPVLLKGSEHIAKWNNKEIPLMVTHALSAGHGLNLQYGGHLLEWFGIQYGLEGYEQSVSRLDRQGQTRPVINSRILCPDTIDMDVLKALQDKKTVQDAVMDAVKARIKKYTR